MSDSNETAQGGPTKGEGEAIKSGLRAIADRLEALPERIAQAMDARTAPRTGPESPPPASGDASPDSPDGASPARKPDPSRLRRDTRRAGIGVLSTLGAAGVPLVGRLAQGMQTADRVAEAFDKWFGARDAEQKADLEAGVAETMAARGPSPSPSPSPVSSASPPPVSSASPPSPPLTPRERSRSSGLDVLHALGSARAPVLGRVAGIAEAFDRWREARRAEGDAEGESPPAPGGVPATPPPTPPTLGSSPSPSPSPPPPRSRPRLASPQRTQIPTSKPSSASEDPRTPRDGLDRLTPPSPSSEPHVGPPGRAGGTDPGTSSRRSGVPPGRPGLHPPGGLTGGPSLPALSGSRPAPSRGDAGSDDAGGDDNKDLLEKILKTLVEMKDAIEERPAAKPVGGPPAAKPAARAARSASADRTARGGGAADAASRAEGMIAFARKLGTAVEAAGS